MKKLNYRKIEALYFKCRLIMTQNNKIIEYKKECFLTAFLCDYSHDNIYKFKIFQWKHGTWKIKEDMSIRHAELEKKNKLKAHSLSR